MALIVGLIVLACALVLIAIAFRISAAITRMSVSMTNGILGGRDLDESDFRRGGGYNSDPIPRPKSLAGMRIPMPGVLYAILLNFMAGIASFVAQLGAIGGLAALFAMSAPAPGDALTPETLGENLAIMAAGWAAGLLATVLVYKLALPTTYVRAGMVVFFQFAIVMVIAVLCGLATVALTASSGGGLPTPKPMNQPTWFK